jgi:hypothetical protein
MNFEARLEGLELVFTPVNENGKLAFLLKDAKRQYIQSDRRFTTPQGLAEVPEKTLFLTNTNYFPMREISLRFCPQNFYDQDHVQKVLLSLKGDVLDDYRHLGQAFKGLNVSASHKCSGLRETSIEGKAERLESFDFCYQMIQTDKQYVLAPSFIRSKYVTEWTGGPLESIIGFEDYAHPFFEKDFAVRGERLVEGAEVCVTKKNFFPPAREFKGLFDD